jgi:hypothetical protein
MDHYSPAYVQKQLGHHSISMRVDIYGHWIPGEGKKELNKTLRCSKARFGRTLALATGADAPQAPQQKTSGEATLHVSLLGPELGPNGVERPKQKA